MAEAGFEARSMWSRGLRIPSTPGCVAVTMWMVVISGIEQPVSSCGVSAGEGDVAHAVSKAMKQILAYVAFPSQK